VGKDEVEEEEEEEEVNSSNSSNGSSRGWRPSPGGAEAKAAIECRGSCSPLSKSLVATNPDSNKKRKRHSPCLA
jgi:hypothetical protein